MIFSLFDLATGKLVGKTIDCPPNHIAFQMPPGIGYVEGSHDHYCRQVNPKTRKVEPYQPPQPSVDHEWNATTERWQLSVPAQASLDADRAARMAILSAEKGNERAVREALLELLPNDSEARLKLQAVDDAIAAQRPNIIRRP